MNINEKIINLYKNTSIGLIEKEKAPKLAMLALFSGESIFLLGPPGVAKLKKWKNIPFHIFLFSS